MKEFIKRELSGWKKLEIAWIVIATIVMLGLSIYLKDTVIGIVSALTGIWCVILTGKGKISSYIFGMVNTLLYAYIAYGAQYYGEVMLNLLYYVPTNVLGFILWKTNMNQENAEVVKKRMSVKTQVLVALGTALGVFLYGLVLKKLGGNMPFVDSMSTMLSVVAQILCVKRYMEQWIIWIVVDVVTIIMWAVVFAQGGESIATLVMWSVYLINAIIMFVKWFKETKKEVANV